MDQETSFRNELLSELIDKMQGRLAEQRYPTEKPKEAEIIAEIKEEPSMSEVSPEEELSDEDLAALTPTEE